MTMETQSYYMQVKTEVEPELRFYRDDLFKHDRAALRNYQGAFLHAHRDTGTDLALLDHQHTTSGFDWACGFLLRAGNSGFLYGDHGTVKRLTRKKAINLLREYALEIVRQQTAEKHLDAQDARTLTRDYLASVPAA
jgi:hypothetical protein